MTYDLELDRRALKEWHKLNASIRQQFKKKLAEVLENPKVQATKLRGLPECYKIKLRSSGYRLIYQVQDERIIVFVVAVGKRENEQAYDDAEARLNR